MSMEKEVRVLNLFQEVCKDGSTDKLEYLHFALGFSKAKAFGYFEGRREREGDDPVWIGKCDIRRK